MALSPNDIASLSRLLDDALAIDAASHEAWLTALPASQRHLAPALREMLAEHSRRTESGPLSTLPRLGDADAGPGPGDRVGPYRLLRAVGQGGMGSVWLAERADGSFQRQVALKLPRLSGSAGLAERMAREREIGAMLEHPHIARLYDAGLDELGRPFIAMAYIDGRPIDQYCREQGLDVTGRLRLVVQVVRAVAHAHGRLVIHRDIKPGNVLVDDQGQAHLLDFGIAKLLDAATPDGRLTQEYGRALTPLYAAPEQLAGRPIGVAADVYSLGVLTYELLTGRLPHQPKRATAAALEEAILEEDAAPASACAKDKALARALRGEIDAILGKALKRDPADRYATADALADDIERHLRGETVRARPDTAAYRLSKAVRRHRGAFAAATAVSLAVLGGGAVATVQAQRAQDEARRAMTVQAFVVDIFRVNSSASDAGAQMRQLPAEVLLQRGAELIDTRFRGQPRVQADLHGVVAGILLDLGSPTLAAQHAQRHVESLLAAGSEDGELARGEMLNAELQYRSGRFAAAEASARAALSRGGSNAALSVDGQRWLALASFSQGRMDDGDRWLAGAESALPALGSAATPQRAEVHWARAQRLAYANQLDAALPLYHQAIDTAMAAEGDLAARVLRMRLRFAEMLMAHGRIGEARRQEDIAVRGLRAQGGTAEIRAAAEESQFFSMLYLYDHVPYDEAAAVLERAQQTMSGGEGRLLPAALRAEVDFRLGWMNSRHGRIDDAQRLLAQSVPLLEQDAAVAARLEPWLYWATGHAAMMAGDHAVAARQFQQHLAHRQRIGMDRHPWTAWTHSHIALNLAMQGQAAQALAMIDALPPFEAPAGGPRSGEPLQDLRITQALLALETGDPRRALSLLPPDGPEADVDAAYADRRLVRGRAMCLLGEPAEGLRLQTERIETLARARHEHAPDVARARALAAQCALDAGRPAEARTLTERAQAAFMAQPGVSGYFKQPMRRLQPQPAQQPAQQPAASPRTRQVAAR